MNKNEKREHVLLFKSEIDYVTLPVTAARTPRSTPDARQHKAASELPAYLRKLVGGCGMTQGEVATALGIAPRTMRRYLSSDESGRLAAPYLVQFAIESLARYAPIKGRSATIHKGNP